MNKVRDEMDDLLPDLCDRYESLVRWLPIQWTDYGKKRPFYGQVVTLRCFEDNSFVRDILSEDGTNKVLIIDGHASFHHALLGDKLAELAQNNHWQGIIINGCVRDVSLLSSFELGIKALGCCPLKTEKRQTGERDVMLTLGDLMIYPGDYVYADLNGVIFSQHPLSLNTE